MKRKILSLLLALCLVVGMVSVAASAEETEIKGFSDLQTAFQNGGNFVLGNDITVEESLTLANDKNLTIDLNGRTIDMGNKSATISGTLTIRDSSAEQNGEITSSSSGQLAKIQNGGTMVLASGNITGKEYIQVRTGGNFNMTGGKIEASGSYALYVYGGTATITGGTVTGEAVYVYSGNFIMGSNSQKQTSAEAQKIYVETLNPKNNDVALYSGIVGKVQSSFGANSTLDCWFESDVSNRVPDGKMCESFTESEKTYYRVVNLTDDKAEAKIGDTLYASAITAATAMQEGETLVLLKNITGDSGDALLKISVPNVTIDLNGFSITNTNENGTGISVEVPYKYNGSTTKGNAVIKNSGGAATVSAATPLRFNVSDGISLQSMKVELSGPITLKPAQAVDSRVSLGNNVYLVYSEEAASMIANGGFKATNEEGSFIYGTASDAIRADKDHTAVLLNDYLGSSSITLASGDTGIVDLNGKTYTVTSGNGINVNDDNTNLTVKNGTVISENGDGAQVGIPAAGQSTSGTSLTLDNVTLTVKGREYGIVSNGTCTGINLTLRNNTVLNASDAVGIYWPSGEGTVIIDNSTITAHTGVQVCAGSLEIKGDDTKITANGTPEKKEEGDGGIKDGAAVSIINRDGYGDLESVKIEAGEFKADSTSKAVKAYTFGKNDTDQEQPWEDAGNVVEISGGAYSSSVAEYVIDSLNYEAHNALYTYHTNFKEAIEEAGNGGTVSSVGSLTNEENTTDLVVAFKDGSKTVWTVNVVENEKITLPSLSNNGYYTFAGWSDGANSYKTGDSVEVTANMTFTAQWNYNPPVNPSNPGGGDDDKPEEPAFPFTDVKSTAWYYNAVKYVYENNLMAGTGDTTFDPEVSLTRAMTAQILYNLEGKPKVDEEATFADMNEAPTWSVDAIAWAQDTGVVAGMGDNEFAPNAKVTREQFAQMMYNYAKYKKYDLTKTGDLSKFPDDGSVSDWAETAMSWANGNGLINGHEDSGLIDPAGNTIRGQAASIIMNFDKNVVK